VPFAAASVREPPSIFGAYRDVRPYAPANRIRAFEAAMSWVPIVVLVCNVTGAGLMAKYGLPSVVPLVGRQDSANEALGLLGLVLFVTSIAVRIADVIMVGF
jgi:hypothetical protein